MATNRFASINPDTIEIPYDRVVCVQGYFENPDARAIFEQRVRSYLKKLIAANTSPVAGKKRTADGQVAAWQAAKEPVLKPIDDHGPGGEQLYGLSREPNDPNKLYIGCDVSDDWFRGDEVGIDVPLSKCIESYVSPPCLILFPNRNTQMKQNWKDLLKRYRAEEREMQRRLAAQAQAHNRAAIPSAEEQKQNYRQIVRTATLNHLAQVMQPQAAIHCEFAIFTLYGNDITHWDPTLVPPPQEGIVRDRARFKENAYVYKMFEFRDQMEKHQEIALAIHEERLDATQALNMSEDQMEAYVREVRAAAAAAAAALQGQQVQQQQQAASQHLAGKASAASRTAALQEAAHQHQQMQKQQQDQQAQQPDAAAVAAKAAAAAAAAAATSAAAAQAAAAAAPPAVAAGAPATATAAATAAAPTTNDMTAPSTNTASATGGDAAAAGAAGAPAAAAAVTNGAAGAGAVAPPAAADTPASASSVLGI